MLRRLLILSLGVLLLPMAGYASIYGVLNGKIVDAEGKPLVGATVQLVGTTYGAFTRPNGEFQIVKIEAGTYDVKVSYVGKKETIRKGVVINADAVTKLEIELRDDTEGAQTDVVEVVGEKNIVRNDAVGTVRGIDGSDAIRLPRETISGAIALTAGVLTGGNGFNVRGARTSETQFRINGLDINDQFSGGFGNLGTAYIPITSPQGTEQVQVVTGGLGAEYGNALGGVINSVTRRGRTDRYEAYLRYRTDLGFAFGDADNGLQAEAANEDRIGFGIGGPIPGIDKFTFFVSGSYFHEEFRNNSIGVVDSWGYNLGARPNNESWVRNLTGTFVLGVTNDIRLEFGGQYGATALERSDWQWLYAEDTALFPDGSTNDIAERDAKQSVNNVILNQAFVRMNHTLSQNSFYELTFSWNFRSNDVSKRKSFDDPTLLGNIEAWEPTDEQRLTTDAEGLAFVENTPDRILDNYAVINEQGLTEDGLLPNSRPGINPLTGYIEGDQNNTGTRNPYGAQRLTSGSGNNFFITHGNERNFDLRRQTYFQVDGNFTTIQKVNDFEHYLKAGFELRVLSLERHQNSLPWNDQPFYDVYTSEWGGNIYAEDPTVRDLTSQAYEPIEGAIYLQDQIKYKGIIFTPGLRLDFMDPQAQFRVRVDSFVSIRDRVATPELFDDAPARIRVSPRLTVAYPVTDRSNLSLSYGVQYQRAPFNNLYDSFNTDLLRGNQIISTPNLEPQTVKAYQVAYNGQFTNDFAFDVTAYYRDMFNLTGITFVPATPVPYSLVSVAEYGNTRGVELSLRKIPNNDNFGASVSYSLSQARGTSSATGTNYTLIVTSGNDGFTDSVRTFPLTEYFLDFDRRHVLNGRIDLIWGDDEGPTIGGLKLLEHTNVNFTSVYQSGRPFTRLNRAGDQVGEYNGERHPDFWRVDTRIERVIPLKDIFGDSFGNTRISLFVDVINVLNRTEPTNFFARTGNPDNDGNVLDRQVGDFSATSFFADKDSDPRASRADQYDTFGNRLYSIDADSNLDGIVTQAEKFEAYERFVSDFQNQRGRYQFPRQVFVGVELRF